MIIYSLEKCSLEDVVRLASEGYYETDTFDLKEALPDKRDIAGKVRLAKTCAAFANSAGGFLVFGVKDNRVLPAEQRIAGIDPQTDFPQNFGEYARKCSPSVDWDFRNPPITLDNGRLVQVAYIPRSWRAPHAVGDGASGWLFPKRTNQGNDYMSYSEVQTMFLGYYEKRLKLQLLRTELLQLAESAASLVERLVALGKTPPSIFEVPLPTFELQVLETVLADTYSITRHSPALLSSLARVRSLVREANSKGGFLPMCVSTYYTPIPTWIKTFDDWVRPRSLAIVEAATESLSHLDAILESKPGKTVP